jgi:hypothetical protein
MSQFFSQQSGQTSISQDVVGVFDGFSQVFRDARPMSASVREEAKLMEHPLESGAVATDHMVIQPVEIELLMTLTPATYRDTFQEIKNLFREAKILTVQTKADTYQNLIIEALPHDEEPEVFDTIDLALKLKEVLVVTAEYEEAPYSPRRDNQSATQDRGEVQPQEQKGSWAARVFGK